MPLHIEGFEPFEDHETNAPGSDRPDDHAFDVVAALHTVGDVQTVI